MGYYTDYQLYVMDLDGKLISSTDINNINLIEELLDDGHTTVEEFLTDTPNLKWYEHEGEMLTLSKKYPQFIFELRGWGDAHDDVWAEWYWNGKRDAWFLEIAFPEIDVKRLKSLPDSEILLGDK